MQNSMHPFSFESCKNNKIILAQNPKRERLNLRIKTIASMTDRLTQLLKLITEMPHDAFLKYGIALEYVSRNDDIEALRHFTELKADKPDYLALYYQLGKLYERLDRTDTAIECYQEGISIARSQKDRHTLSELQSALDELL